jgi:hypothetical protein
MLRVACVGLVGALLVGCGNGVASDDDSGSGGSGVGGEGGDGQPDTRIVSTWQGKLDVLFAIDDSPGMLPKQALLVPALSRLFDRLGADVDIHAGVVTSNLGGHGGDLCATKAGTPAASLDERGHLVGSSRAVDSDDPHGFLTHASGESALDFAKRVATHVMAAGSGGCGLEAQLESVYRFLADPNPPTAVTSTGQVSKASGTDSELLEQRAAFLRPDSAVLVVLLTDENDCSIMDTDQGFLAARSDFRMPRASSACATSPSSACCRPCVLNESSPPAGCQSLKTDSACQKGTSLTFNEDSLNLRCFQQKERFGLNFLYPTLRYVNALTQTKLCTSRTDLDATGGCPTEDLVSNPLFSDLSGKNQHVRSPSLVSFAALVGAPWQDFASEDSLPSDVRLHVLTSAELESEGRWPMLGGTGAKPTDPFMQESTSLRTGTNSLVDETPTNVNPLNGGDRDTGMTDLEYASLFLLRLPSDCTAIDSCPCSDPASTNPVCTGTMLTSMPVLPGLRELEVLHELGAAAVAASSVPKCEGGDGSDPGFGYNPAMDAVLDHLKERWSVPIEAGSLASDDVCGDPAASAAVGGDSGGVTFLGDDSGIPCTDDVGCFDDGGDFYSDL